MESSRVLSQGVLCGLILLGVTQSGCVIGPQPRPFKITLVRDAKLADDVIVVDVIGVGEGAKERVAAAMQDGTYFKEDGDIRKPYLEGKIKLGRTFQFESVPGTVPTRQVLNRRDTIWRDWRKGSVQYLIVAANMRLLEESDSKADPRLLVIPFNKRKLSPVIQSDRAVEIRLNSRGLSSSPPLD